MDASSALDLFDPTPADRADYERLLRDPGEDVDPDALARVRAALRASMADIPPVWPAVAGSEQTWLVAFAEECGALVDCHRERGVDEDVTAATLADVGRQLAITRTMLGRFGLENWWWILAHYTGTLFQLGRLQYLLRPQHPWEPDVPGLAEDAWVLDVHIPGTGALTPDAVERSAARATDFFAEHFPAHPAGAFVCFSWLLDPYLAEHLPGSNIAAFQHWFRPYGEPVDAQSDAVYFVFRTRSTAPADLARLPRDTTLQRLVLDRIARGGTWQNAYGYRPIG